MSICITRWQEYRSNDTPHDYALSFFCLDGNSWYVVPADDKETTRLIVSQIVLDAREGLRMASPKTTAKRRLELQAIKKLLTK